jgi:hypothetical protein
MSPPDDPQDPPRLRSPDGGAPDEVRQALDAARQQGPSDVHLQRLRGQLRERIGGPGGGGGAAGGTSSVARRVLQWAGGLTAAAALGGVLWFGWSSGGASGAGKRPEGPHARNAAARDAGGEEATPHAGRAPVAAGQAADSEPGPPNPDGTPSVAPDPEPQPEPEADSPSPLPGRRRRPAAGPDSPGSDPDPARGASARSADGGTKAGGPSELELVRRAQDALRNGTPERALAVATEHGRRYPDGMLSQEREVIAVHALLELGRIERARARARRLTQRHPSSPHVARVERLLRRHTSSP